MRRGSPRRHRRAACLAPQERVDAPSAIDPHLDPGHIGPVEKLKHELSLVHGHRTRTLRAASSPVSVENYAQVAAYASPTVFTIGIEPPTPGVAFVPAAATGLSASTASEHELGLVIGDGRVNRVSGTLTVPVLLTKQGTGQRNRGTLLIQLQTPDGPVAQHWSQAVSIDRGRARYRARLKAPPPGEYAVSASFEGDANEPSVIRPIQVPGSRPGPFLIGAGSLVGILALGSGWLRRRGAQGRGDSARTVVLLAGLMALTGIATFTGLTDAAPGGRGQDRTVTASASAPAVDGPSARNIGDATNALLRAPAVAERIGTAPFRVAPVVTAVPVTRWRVVTLPTPAQRPRTLLVGLDAESGRLTTFTEKS